MVLFKPLVTLLCVTLSITGILFSTVAFSQEVRYVSSKLTAALRAGGGMNYRIVNFLESGTRIIITDPNALTPDAEWIAVETENGKQGWMKREHVALTPPPYEALSMAETALTELKEQSSEQNSEIKMLKDKLAELEGTRKGLDQALTDVKTSYETLKQTSAEAVELKDDNMRLAKQLELIKIKLEEVKVENKQLKDNKYVDGISHGIVAVVIGCLLALILPRFGTKKRTSGWD